ncbi:MAG: nitroreductase family protein [Clostridiales bacterium]|nr:nitroreductase family protein [Candidatus Crickella merdequi]
MINNEILKNIADRRSVRRYKDMPVEDDKLMTILEAGRQAPSGHNRQPWWYIIVRDEATKRAIAEADHGQEWMCAAPVFIICVADQKAQTYGEIFEGDELVCDEKNPTMALKRAIRDTAASVENILLAAESVGLSTCWTGWYHQADVKPILGIPDDKYVVAIITLGYGDETPDARPRRDLEEIVMFEKWDR